MAKRSGKTKRTRVTTRRRLVVEHLDQRRVLAAISGAVFADLDHSFQRDANESGLAKRLIYIDANNNAALDVGEAFTVADADGGFRFTDLADGSYLLRMFNGSSGQRITSPVDATADGPVLPITEAARFQVDGDNVLVQTSTSIVIGDLQSGTGQTIQVGQDLVQMQTLPDGKVLVVGNHPSGPTAWVVDTDASEANPIAIAGSNTTPWSQLALDRNGRGVLLNQSSGASTVHTVDASGGTTGIVVAPTPLTVPGTTQILASNSGSRSVFATPDSDGLDLRLWSNTTASFIGESVAVEDRTQLLAFDDASGILAIRTSAGGIGIHDADANFAPLHTIADATGPVAIDSARDLLVTLSPLDAMLKMFDLTDGTLIANLAVDLSSIGQVTAISLDHRHDSVVVLGAAGITEVALRRARAQEVQIQNGQDVDAVLFGVTIDGENTPPTLENVPAAIATEDTPLIFSAADLLSSAGDAQGDAFIVLQESSAQHGDAILGIDGSLVYTPEADFNGTDTVSFKLFDGRDESQVFVLNIDVAPTPDPPRGVAVHVDSIPEDVEPGQPIGTIEVIDADGPNHQITINDDRWSVVNGSVVLAQGNVDFEREPFVPITVTVVDLETNDRIEQSFVLSVNNVNEPITGISPTTAELLENNAGGEVAFITVDDPDFNQEHTLTVDDDRFEITAQDVLKLKEDIAIDFEQEPIVVVTVTATEIPDGGTFSQPITIRISDVAEQPRSIELSERTVTEFVFGDTVGEVTVDGAPANERFNLTVDDGRFQIVDGVLKLTDEAFVERATQSEVELTITATDTSGQFDPVSQTFVIEVMENLTPSHNHDNPFDVDHGGTVTTYDILLIINYLNEFGPGPVRLGTPGPCYDVNGDGMITALDALLVLNEINRIAHQNPTVGSDAEQPAEGEQTNAPGVTTGPTNTHEQDDHAADLSSTDSGDHPSTVANASDKIIATATPSDSDPATIDIPVERSNEEFAKRVDETLKLLGQ